MEIPIIIGFVSFIPILDLTPAFHFKHCQQSGCWRGLTLNKVVDVLGARKICNKYGYDLAIVNNNETQMFMEELLRSKDLELNRDSLFFIGLTRRMDQWFWLNGSYIEVSDHRRSFYNWDVNEPSTGSCVAVRIENFKWITLPCKSGFKFILCSTKNDQISSFSDEEVFHIGMKRKLKQVSLNASQDNVLYEQEALSPSNEAKDRMSWIFSNVMTSVVVLLGVVMAVLLIQIKQTKMKVDKIEKELQGRYRGSFMTSSTGSIGYSEIIF